MPFTLLYYQRMEKKINTPCPSCGRNEEGKWFAPCPSDDCPSHDKTIIGKQYGHRSSANRAISRFQVRYFATIPKGFHFWVNQLDEGCYVIEGAIT